MIDSERPTAPGGQGNLGSGSAPRGPSGTTYLVLGIVVGILIGASVVALVGAPGILSAFSKSNNVAISTTFEFTGTRAGVWVASGCPGGQSQPGAEWQCLFTLTASGGASYESYTVESVTLIGATLLSISPSTPQTVSGGSYVNYELELTVPSSASGSLSVQIVAAT
jgi:hypothetical protein